MASKLRALAVKDKQAPGAPSEPLLLGREVEAL